VTFSWLRWPRFGDVDLFINADTDTLPQTIQGSSGEKKTQPKWSVLFQLFANESTRVLETNLQQVSGRRPHGTGKESLHHPLRGDQPTQHRLKRIYPMTWDFVFFVQSKSLPCFLSPALFLKLRTPEVSCLTLVIHAWLKRPSLRCSQDQGESLKEPNLWELLGAVCMLLSILDIEK